MEADDLLSDVKNILCNVDFEGYQPEEISKMYPLIVEMTTSFLNKCEEKMNSFFSQREKDILKTVVYNFFTLGLRVICTEFSERQLDQAANEIFTPLKAKFLNPPVVANVPEMNPEPIQDAVLTVEDVAEFPE